MIEKQKHRFSAVPSYVIELLSADQLFHHSIENKDSGLSLFSNLKHMIKNPRFWILLLIIFGVFNLDRLLSTPNPCVVLQDQKAAFASLSKGYARFLRESVGDYAAGQIINLNMERYENGGVVNGGGGGGGDDESPGEFWKQPNGMGYRPCLEFSDEYRRESEQIVKNKADYLITVVSGGLNQQKNQIVDSVLIARILGAVLVVPVLQVNIIWGDESEFSDIFDLNHFKEVLKNDVKIVSSIPSTYLAAKPVVIEDTPFNMTPEFIRSKYLKMFGKEGVMILRSLDSRLSFELPPDLQKLRCKVAFEALKYAPKIVELGNKLTERMKSNGPYIALHLRMEKDVWVRTGCLPGLGPEYDEIVENERKMRPELLTSRRNMSYHERRIAGLCPMNAFEITRLLKALGAPKGARIYWAGGEPLGGKEALQPLSKEYPHLYNKEDIALPGELEPFADKASIMAAIDSIVSENSDVFMASHGGNMGRLVQGSRAFAGHKKSITPNKRHMLPYYLNSSLPEAEFNRIIKKLHRHAIGEPVLRANKPDNIVTRYPVPDCMCNTTESTHSFVSFFNFR